MSRITIVIMCLLIGFYSYAQIDSTEVLSHVVLEDSQSGIQQQSSTLNTELKDHQDSVLSYGQDITLPDSLHIASVEEIQTNEELVKGLISKKEKVAEFVSLSLVDGNFYSDFEVGIATLKQKYEDQELLLTVTNGFSEQRVFFLSAFYTSIGSGESAYASYKIALARTKKVYKNLDFKYYYLEH